MGLTSAHPSLGGAETNTPGGSGARSNVQGVIKSYDPKTRAGVLVDDSDRVERELSPHALEGSIFRMLRQGQRVVYDLEADGTATKLRLGSEIDLGPPEW